MKKIILKLDAHSMIILRGFLDFSLQNIKEFDYNPKLLSDKHVMVSLTELHERIHTAYNPYAVNYKIKVTHSMAIGFLRHCLTGKHFIPKENALIINNVLGLIDQQTK